jgi:uncharacterized protein YkwD
MTKKKSALSNSLNEIAVRANKKAHKEINAKRKKNGLPALKYNPNRNYWI